MVGKARLHPVRHDPLKLPSFGRWQQLAVMVIMDYGSSNAVIGSTEIKGVSL